MGGVDVLVVTALQEEFDAARDVVWLEYRILGLACMFAVSGSIMRRGDTRW
jgi:hypothetical protein